jgi:hypothetical protein
VAEVCFGVAGGVGDRLGGDPQGGHLDGGRQVAKLAGCLDGDRQRALEAGGLFADCRHEAQLVECWRAQVVDEPAHVGYRALGLPVEAVEQNVGGVRVAPQQVPCGGDAQRDAGEQGTQTVVQVTPQAPALLLPRRDQPFPGLLQVGGQTHGVGRHAELAGDAVEQLPFGAREHLPGPARRQHQPANLLTLEGQR